MVYCEINVLYNSITINRDIEITSDNSSVLTGGFRPENNLYIPVVIQQSSTTTNNTHIYSDNDKWFIITDVKQDYVIRFYKVN